MAFKAGYIYNFQMSPEFRNLSRTLDRSPFTVQEFLDLIEAVELGALSLDRLDEMKENWASKYILPNEKDVYLEMIAHAKISPAFKTQLGEIVDMLVAAQSKAISLDDRLGLIASNFYTIQDFLQNQGAELLNINFLTHFHTSEKIMSLSRGNIARGLSFGLARNTRGVLLSTFKTINLKDEQEFFSVFKSNRIEDQLLEEYTQLHQDKLESWDNRVNSVAVDPRFQNKITNLLDTRASPDRFEVSVAPAFFYGSFLVQDDVWILGQDAPEKVIVEDRALYEATEQYHMSKLLESLRSTILIFMDVNFLNSTETLGVVPIAFQNSIYLIIEYNRLVDGGPQTQRLGVVYQVKSNPGSGLTLTQLVKRHIPVFAKIVNSLPDTTPEDHQFESMISAKLTSLANGRAH